MLAPLAAPSLLQHNLDDCFRELDGDQLARYDGHTQLPDPVDERRAGRVPRFALNERLDDETRVQRDRRGRTRAESSIA